MKIILASASPRRHDILNLVGIDHEVITSHVDERLLPDSNPAEIVMQLSFQKAAAVAKSHLEALVIGADTIVVLENEILGKPISTDHAKETLEKLSDRTHTVYTGVSLMQRETVESFYEQTEVTFYPLTDDEIAAYIATGEPMDKAGAYGIQGYGAVLVKGIAGDYFNVMGLPIAKTVRRIRSF